MEADDGRSLDGAHQQPEGGNTVGNAAGNAAGSTTGAAAGSPEKRNCSIRSVALRNVYRAFDLNGSGILDKEEPQHQP